MTESNVNSSSDHTQALQTLYLKDLLSNAYFLIDSGASLSVLPPRQEDLKNEETKLKAANGITIKTYEDRFIKLDFGTGCTFEWVFHIADVKKPIIGIEFLRNFEFSIIQLMEKQEMRLQKPNCP